MAAKKGIILSGMRPTGRLHLGNLFGALENWINLQDQYDCYFCVVDWHALTTSYEDPGNIQEDIREMVMDWLSCGIDPEKATLFKQSDVVEHAELHLLFSMLTPLSWLERCPTYKEQMQQMEGRNLATYGFLGYPLLQAADILIYKANAVPVGEDQAPHIELTREVARRFNHLYGKQVFPEPETLLNEFKTIPGLDKRKMSKSYNNYIEIAISPEKIPEKVRMMITDPARIRKDDPGNPEICSVFAFQRIFNAREAAAIAQECRDGAIGCVQCKNLLAGKMKEYMEPIYHRRKEIESKPQLVDEVLARGGEQARRTAQTTMKEVRSAMGLT